MADKLATAFTAVANPADATLMMLADPASGERQRIDIGTFFNRSQGFSFGAAVVSNGSFQSNGTAVFKGLTEVAYDLGISTLTLRGIQAASGGQVEFFHNADRLGAVIAQTDKSISINTNGTITALTLGVDQKATFTGQVTVLTGAASGLNLQSSVDSSLFLNFKEKNGTAVGRIFYDPLTNIMSFRNNGADFLTVAATGAAAFLSSASDSPSVASMLVTGGSSSNAGDHLWQKWERGDGTGNAVELRKSDLVGGAGAAFGTSAATPFIFFTNSVESLRLHSDGSATFSGATATFASGVGGIVNLTMATGNMANVQYRRFTIAGTSTLAGGGASRQFVAGVRVNSAAGVDGFGYLQLEAENGNNYNYWTGNDNNLRTSTSSTNWGTNNGILIGTQTSDARVKKIAKSLFSYGLNEVVALADKAIEFSYGYDKKNQKHLGFSAQEVQKVIPEAVYNTKDSMTVDGKEYKDILAMDSRELMPVLFKAIAELNKKIENK